MKKLQFYLLSVLLLLTLIVNAQSGFQQNGTSLYYNNGNVGIGKTNPEYTLDVNGTLYANEFKLDGLIRRGPYPFTYNNVSFQHFSLGWVDDPSVTPENGHALWLSGYGGMKFFTTGQPRLTIATPGNIGIGTTTPEELLTVNGGVLKVKNMPSSENEESLTTISLENKGINGLPHKWNLNTASKAGFQGVTSNGFEIYEYPSLTNSNSNCCMKRFVIETGRDKNHNPVIIGPKGSLNIGYDSSFRATDVNELSVNGNVGIGTLDTQGYKLAVNGKIRAKEIVVDSNWADFVFDDSYDLPDLDFVAEHIKEKKHLPGIPPADKIHKDGVSLGEINTMLLQKIEEQTLYILELHEQIQAIKKRMNDLEK